MTAMPEYEHAPTPVEATETDVVRHPFSIGQFIAICSGIFLIVTGGIGLARMGVDTLRSETTEVLGLGMTPLLALIHVGVGVFALLGAMGRVAARSMDIFLGALVTAAGIVVLIEPTTLQAWLAMSQMNGLAYLIIGAVMLLAAVMTPMIMTTRRHVTTA